MLPSRAPKSLRVPQGFLTGKPKLYVGIPCFCFGKTRIVRRGGPAHASARFPSPALPTSTYRVHCGMNLHHLLSCHLEGHVRAKGQRPGKCCLSAPAPAVRWRRGWGWNAGPAPEKAACRKHCDALCPLFCARSAWARLLSHWGEGDKGLLVVGLRFVIRGLHLASGGGRGKSTRSFVVRPHLEVAHKLGLPPALLFAPILG